MRSMTSPLAALALLAVAGCADRARPAGDALGLAGEARAQVDGTRARGMGCEAVVLDPILDADLLFRARPDACFDRIGVDAGAPPCAAGDLPKREQTDLTVGVRSGGHAYFGTAANVVCIALAVVFDDDPLAPFATDQIVCELGSGEDRRVVEASELGDARPPRMYRVDAVSDRVRDITPVDDPLLADTIGLSGAGAFGDVVLYAGPNLGPDGFGGLNLFAFEGSTGRSLGSTTLPEYIDMRSGVVVNGALYLGARKTGQRAEVGGYVVKWVGDKIDPFRFEAVGELGTVPGSLVAHAGRIAVGGMADLRPGEDAGAAGIWLGPVVREGGLDGTDLGQWERIFGVEEYEPDPVLAGATSIGEVASFGGRLFFGTFAPPLLLTKEAFAAYGRPETWWERLFDAIHYDRAAALLVIDDAGEARQATHLLYGDAELAVFDPLTGGIDGRPNGLGQEPAFGPAGFGNRSNHGIVDMAVFDGRLYLSTLDGSGPAAELFGPLVAQAPVLDLPQDVVDVFQPLLDVARTGSEGGDLYRIDLPYAPVVAEDLTGLGNRSNAAVRVLLPFTDQGKLYAGTANPFNLRAGPDDPGGFEVLMLTPLVE